MKIHLLAKSLLIGLSIAAPVGAINLLCINRTLSQGILVGFISGLGVATADGVYGCVAGFGLTNGQSSGQTPRRFTAQGNAAQDRLRCLRARMRPNRAMLRI